MNLHKSNKEVIIQQLNCLSRRYEELLKLFDEPEKPLPQQTTKKPSWTIFFKIRSKKTRK